MNRPYFKRAKSKEKNSVLKSKTLKTETRKNNQTKNTSRVNSLLLLFCHSSSNSVTISGY